MKSTINIAIAVPLPNQVPQDFPRTLTSIIAYTRNNLKGLDQLHYFDKSGVRTDRNRNIILEQILKHDIDYVLWLDVDMIYPPDIICKYLVNDFDVMGCLYFKRAEPFDPVGYIKGDNPIKPYKPLDVRLIPKDTILEVDGIGFGGMMVNMNVYKMMGEDKWMKYSDNFHLPYETNEPKLTHDLLFCKKAQEYGAKILLHTGVRPAHMGEIAITEKHWLQEKQKEPVVPKIAVIMPTIRPEMAEKTVQILKKRAGMDADYFPTLDADRVGYASICNQTIGGQHAYDYYCYVSDDLFPSRNWLKDAYDLLVLKGGKLLGFNDGKWKGNIATSGLVEASWMRKNYDGALFHPGYFGHYNDMELTLIAKQDKVYCYDANISLAEIDYEKEGKKVHPQDKALFAKRKETKFDGLVTNQLLIDSYT